MPCSSRGVFRRRSIGGARCGCPATAARNRRLTREARGTARQALRPGCEELAARVAEDNSADGSAAPGQKSPRWSAERRASRVMGRRAPRKRPGVPRYGMPNRVPLHPGACRRSAHPSRWGFNFTTRAQSRRGNEECCVNGLFEIVRVNIVPACPCGTFAAFIRWFERRCCSRKAPSPVRPRSSR